MLAWLHHFATMGGAVYGPIIFALKYTLLFIALTFYYLAARNVLIRPGVSAAAIAAWALTFQVGWSMHEDLLGAVALMACLSTHAKDAPDVSFMPFLPLLEDGARDERNFVKKAVSWGLRGIGRRSPALDRDVLLVAARLAASTEPSCRWVGRDVERDLAKVKARRR